MRRLSCFAITLQAFFYQGRIHPEIPGDGFHHVKRRILRVLPVNPPQPFLVVSEFIILLFFRRFDIFNYYLFGRFYIFCQPQIVFNLNISTRGILTSKAR